MNAFHLTAIIKQSEHLYCAFIRDHYGDYSIGNWQPTPAEAEADARNYFTATIPGPHKIQFHHEPLNPHYDQ
jgi:hypothetical protein